MHKIRLYHPEKFQVNDTVILSEAASRHLIQVLRKGVGEEIYIFNGDGFEYKSEVISAEKKKVSVLIGESADPKNESPIKIHLGQGLSRGDRMDFAIQKAVEIGVSEITPLITECSQVKLSQDRSKKRMQHWQAIAISAAEQSGRCIVPVINNPMKFFDWVESEDAELKFICCPKTESVDVKNIKPKTISLAIGPESGFSDSEVEGAINKGFHSLFLGPRILRTETAAIVASTIVQKYFGDL